VACGVYNKKDKMMMIMALDRLATDCGIRDIVVKVRLPNHIALQHHARSALSCYVSSSHAVHAVLGGPRASCYPGVGAVHLVARLVDGARAGCEPQPHRLRVGAGSCRVCGAGFTAGTWGAGR
jgi:hypothetical protein